MFFAASASVFSCVFGGVEQRFLVSKSFQAASSSRSRDTETHICVDKISPLTDHARVNRSGAGGEEITPAAVKVSTHGLRHPEPKDSSQESSQCCAARAVPMLLPAEEQIKQRKLQQQIKTEKQP